MRRQILTVLVCFVAIEGILPADPIIRFKRRLRETPNDLGAYRLSPLKRRQTRSSHYLIQFAAQPSTEQIQELRRRGPAIMSYVPDAALVVAAADDVSWEGLGLKYVGRLDELDKLSEKLADNPAPESRNVVVVEFYPDVDANEARAIVQERNLLIDERSNLLPYQLLVEGPLENILRLAEWDEVAYVYPASPELVNGEDVRPCAGPMIAEGPIAQYVVSSGWPKPNNGHPVELKYVFGVMTSKLPASIVQSEMIRAFDLWSQSANVKLVRGHNPSANQTMNIFFGSGAHGDMYPFDGPGGVLAHTFIPSSWEPLAGDTHFDADETWQVGAPYDVFSVALHEAGHALGMLHNFDNPAAVMYPWYKMNTGLNADDIAGIQKLYGPPQQSKH